MPSQSRRLIMLAVLLLCGALVLMVRNNITVVAAQTGVAAAQTAIQTAPQEPSPQTGGSASVAPQQPQASRQSQPSRQSQAPSRWQREQPLRAILQEKGLSSLAEGLILIDKSDKTLSLVYDGTILKNYHVEFGDGGMGDKQVSGDHKTPEGTFYVMNREVLSPADPYLGSRWFGVSYPNIEDAERGLKQGLISQSEYGAIVAAVNSRGTPLRNTALGGGIGIHGGSTPALGANWTWGCVGLKNADIEDLFDFVPAGTRIVIQR